MAGFFMAQKNLPEGRHRSDTLRKNRGCSAVSLIQLELVVGVIVEITLYHDDGRALVAAAGG